MKHIITLTATVFLAACITTPTPPKRAQYREIDVNGKIYSYTALSCGHTVSYQGHKLNLEGVNIPDVKKPASFTVGKVGYEITALNQIKATIKKLDDLQVATCQTLIRLKDEANIIKYSEYRDSVYKELLSYSEKLDTTSEQKVALEETMKTEANLQKLEADKPA